MSVNHQDVEALVGPLQQLHRRIRDCVVLACEQSSMELMTKVDEMRKGDTVFAIDQISRRLLVNFFTSDIAPHTSVVLLAEGLPDGKLVLPQGTPEDEAVWRIVVDELGRHPEPHVPEAQRLGDHRRRSQSRAGHEFE